MSKKVLIIVSNAHEIGPRKRRTGVFLSEVAHPYAEFDKAGYRIDLASLTGETPYLDALNLADDPQNLAFLTGKGWASMQKAKKLSDVDVSGYDAIFVPEDWRRWSTCPNTRSSSRSSKRRTSATRSSARSATDRYRC